MALDLIAELEALISAFEREQIDYALCGGLAVAIHGHPRATMDIDMLVPPEAVTTALAIGRSCGFDISKLDPETNQLVALDLLVVGPALEEVWQTRVVLPLGGRPIRVVSREGLASMKRLAGRPQDLADLAQLEGTGDDDEA